MLADQPLDCNYSDSTSYKIPIVAWRLRLGENNIYQDDQKIKDINECGFNTVLYFDNNKLNIDSICNLLANNDLNVIVGSDNLRSDKAEIYVNKLSSKKNILCWFIADEPYFDNLVKLRKAFDRLKRISLNIPIYINLIGSPSNKYTGNCKNMNEYLDTIEHVFNPLIWSYDYYPISILNGKIEVNYSQFFSSLKAFHDKSYQTQRPFWAFCQTMEFKNSNVERPAATLSYLRLEAFCALGFGAKGIVYWSYQLAKSTKEQYLSALIDSTGSKFPAWYYAQQVNREISAFNDVFNHSKINRVYIPNQGLLSDNVNSLFNVPIDAILDFESTGVGFFISDFSSNGKNYIMILNLDVKNSQDIIAILDSKNQYWQLEYKNPDSIRKKKVKSNSYRKSLSPGGYTILSYM